MAPQPGGGREAGAFPLTTPEVRAEVASDPRARSRPRGNRFGLNIPEESRSLMRRLIPVILSFALAFLASPLAAFQLTPIDDKTLVALVTAEGATAADAIAAAKVEAVRGSAGRVLLGDQLIMADEILAKYLANYAGQFVKAVEVLETEFVAGRNRVTAKVFVDYAALTADLTDKRFLYKPAYRPRFASFMTERQDGRVVSEGAARNALAVELNNLGMRRYGRDLDTPPATSDVSGDDFLMQAAVVSSQRAGVEVLVTGETTTVLKDQQKLYFDEYWFYETEMKAKIIRVDTGEVLVEARSTGSASDKDATAAVQQAIQRAAKSVATQLVPPFESTWPVLVQRKSDYEILLTGSNADLVSIITEHVKRLGGGTQVHVRKSFDKTASLAVVTDQPKDALIENLRSCTYPNLSVVNPGAERVFEVQVSF